MQCPDCASRVRGNFCSQCGRQLPYLIGASFPYGLRFPAPAKGGVRYQAAVNLARSAPRYWEKTTGETLYHHACYDLGQIRRLVELQAAVRKAFPGREELIEHTADGRRFTAGPVPWGCHYAQDRQPRYYHVDGKEVFRHGVHGFFACDGADEERFGRPWPAGLRERLAQTPFRVDKRAIRDGVMRLIKRFGANRCPAFSARYLDAQLEAIPNTLIPADNTLWRVEELPGYWPGVALLCYQPKAVLNLDQRTVIRGELSLGTNEII